MMADTARIVPADVSSTNTNIAAWLSSLAGMSHGTASNPQLEEVSFRDAKAWRTDAATWPVRGGALNPVVATQERRVDRLRP
jgi:hypothetical protein